MAAAACPTDDPSARPVTTFDPARRDAPVLVYDGDCGFCAWWARYWQELTGSRVRYAPYQVAAPHFPDISEAAFRGAVRYIALDGSVAGGAAAAFRTLSHAPGHGHWLRLYRHLPGFALVSETVYGFVAGHRPLAGKLTRWLWGPRPEPSRYGITAGLFLRLLGLVYLAAFFSLGVQVAGLIGSRGILPAGAHFAALENAAGATAWLQHPSLFWLGAGDGALQAACWLGAAASLAVVANRAAGPALFLAWVLYLSLYHAGQVFMEYQWDLLLLEAGFLGWLLTSGSRLPLWLLRWLLFRFILLSGAVKLASGDAAWSSLRALGYHFETQPLPTPLAWHAQQLPEGLLGALVAAHFVIELVLPFFIFLPRRPRLLAAAGFLALQAFIMATGNYGFFNLLVLALTVTLLDDQSLSRALPGRLAQGVALRGRREPGRLRGAAIAVFAALSVGVGTAQAAKRISLDPDTTVLPALAPFRVVNPYGVFANMVMDRRELSIEGSDDGMVWRELAFRFKPGPPDRAPGWNVPHQPRLDWQMWFAALGDARESPWLVPFLARLLDGAPEVRSLLDSAGWRGPPPRQVRIVLWRYRFATPEEHAREAWWMREAEGEYLAPVTRETVADALRRGATPESLIRWR